MIDIKLYKALKTSLVIYKIHTNLTEENPMISYEEFNNYISDYLKSELGDDLDNIILDLCEIPSDDTVEKGVENATFCRDSFYEILSEYADQDKISLEECLNRLLNWKNELKHLPR